MYFYKPYKKFYLSFFFFFKLVVKFNKQVIIKNYKLKLTCPKIFFEKNFV
jgi:hypothetical protein